MPAGLFVSAAVVLGEKIFLPPKPVAKPTVPSVASISRKNEPSTLMPQLVLEARYFSHLEHGVEMGESMSLLVSACVERGDDRLTSARL
jgi:hypothetical protein